MGVVDMQFTLDDWRDDGQRRAIKIVEHAGEKQQHGYRPAIAGFRVSSISLRV